MQAHLEAPNVAAQVHNDAAQEVVPRTTVTIPQHDAQRRVRCADMSGQW